MATKKLPAAKLGSTAIDDAMRGDLVIITRNNRPLVFMARLPRNLGELAELITELRDITGKEE